ncbi:uncharacterized protein BO96DRAFT_343599 [Aspergillus niger CBS 101883]|uniref:uncharacterized protein n=1 Tax=Aspergillus lacticoffeatus (strain CBS 101883) TaxID=1450533 RepID=UPI000D7EFFD4|nr:uncharacterized protein BO96DRAFT_343599 [Aspergillus niger CBS 101883]PYH53942.1 hypothetical protein BO96DRAFT_343599 [Aspergillus niger CBS 101883]
MGTAGKAHRETLIKLGHVVMRRPTRRLIGPSSLTSKSSHPRMSTGNSTNAAVSAKPCRHGKQLPRGHTAGSSYQWYCLAPHSLAVRYEGGVPHHTYWPVAAAGPRGVPDGVVYGHVADLTTTTPPPDSGDGNFARKSMPPPTIFGGINERRSKLSDTDGAAGRF